MKYIYTTPDVKCLSESLRQEVNTYKFSGSPLSTAALGSGVYLDIASAPHVLVAGTTGSGKSVMLHNIICSLLVRNNPDTARFLLIDPKMVEFRYFYKNLPLLYCGVVSDPKEALMRLEEAEREMMRRYEVIEAEGKRFWTGSKLYIVIDEIADLVSDGGKRLERCLEKIARLGRGAGVHLIAATQHPTAQVLSRQITTNLDVRICLRVNDGSASRLVLGRTGGERLKGKGDAIIRMNGEYTRFQAAYIDDDSLEAYAHSWNVREIQDEITISFVPQLNTFCAQ
jgi:S-DNA-T family DNA segregation ATPase FtsK/SpoIIIE